MGFKFFISAFFCTVSLFGLSQDAFFTNSIPDSLYKDANALVVYSGTEVEVYSTTSLKLKVHKVITVYNQQGVEQATMAVVYDKFRRPSNIKISTYALLGMNEKKIKQNEIVDAALSDGFSIYNDERIKYYKPLVDYFPFTIDYSYEVDFNGYTHIPSWNPVPDFNVSVVYSSYQIAFKEDLGIRYKSLQNGGVPVSSFYESKKLHTWTLANFKALKQEPYSPGIENLAPRVLIGCNQFGYDGFPGDFSTWGTFGKWVADLMVNRQELPAESKAKIMALVAGIESPKEKAAVLYQYLQAHMRYVSIQLGIGGFQPFSASEVDKLGYGDCKALSNYYISLLQLAGIQGLYALTTASSDHQGFYEDFPANIYFNHAVVCIPFQNDTTWVECTNNYLPFGFMGRRVAGQPALLITAEGGVLTKIPQLPGDKNNEFRSLKIQLNEEGDALMDLNVRYLGEQLTDGLAEYVKSPSEQLKSIYNDIEINEFKVLSHQYSFQKGKNPGIHLNAKLQAQALAQISGDRMFIPVQLLDNPISTPEIAAQRKFPVQINWSYFDSDTIVLSLPIGYSVEMLPKPLVSVTEFGVYELNVSANQNEVVIIKSFRLKAGRYPSESYTALRDFLLQIHKANRQKLIVRKSA